MTVLEGGSSNTSARGQRSSDAAGLASGLGSASVPNSLMEPHGSRGSDFISTRQEAMKARWGNQLHARKTQSSARAKKKWPRLLTPAYLLNHVGETSAGHIGEVLMDGHDLADVSDDAEWRNFSSLTALDLGENSLAMAKLAVFGHLRELHLYCNGIRFLEVPPTAFGQLKTLNLAFNCIVATTLSELAKIPTLQFLDLTSNELTSIPFAFDQLINLEVLVLERNYLHSEASLHILSTMPRLVELNLNYNRISRIPDDVTNVGHFVSLAILCLSNNELKTEEDFISLTRLPALKEVDLWDNPILRRRSRRSIRSDNTTPPLTRPSAAQRYLPQSRIGRAYQSVLNAVGHTIGFGVRATCVDRATCSMLCLRTNCLLVWHGSLSMRHIVATYPSGRHIAHSFRCTRHSRWFRL